VGADGAVPVGVAVPCPLPQPLRKAIKNEQTEISKKNLKSPVLIFTYDMLVGVVLSVVVPSPSCPYNSLYLYAHNCHLPVLRQTGLSLLLLWWGSGFSFRESAELLNLTDSMISTISYKKVCPVCGHTFRIIKSCWCACGICWTS